ncbi:class III lanthipeptide [Lentzea sp. NPDC004782]|jgi:hypothetical protein
MNVLRLQTLEPQAPSVGLLGNSCTSSITGNCCNGAQN